VLRKLLRAKIHRATVTHCDLNYEGSISVDADLLARATIAPHEGVHVWNVSNGARLETYALEAAAGSGEIKLNGAAARLGQPGDLVIIAAFGWLDDRSVAGHHVQVVAVDGKNRPQE